MKYSELLFAVSNITIYKNIQMTEVITKLIDHAFIVLFLWVIMICTVCIDLWTGIDKAKAKHEPIHSKALRMTFCKIGEYWRVMVMFLFADTIGCLLPWWNLPYFSMICTLAIILIEFRSVMENLKEKKSNASEVLEVVEEIINTTSTEKAIDLIKKVKNTK